MSQVVKRKAVSFCFIVKNCAIHNQGCFSLQLVCFLCTSNYKGFSTENIKTAI